MIQIPGYLIKREIGIGGMAKVYLAVQTSLEREVALKVMNPAMVSDPSFSRRFTQEARTLASLTHPNIVAVYDVGITEEKLHYFSMQLLPNGDFLKRIRNGVPEAEVIRVLSGVARALGFAHQRGIVHRDVAPGNVLFDPNDNPVLTDFGIARAVTRTSRITNAGVSVGTSHYMSPEQARGSEVDGRSDVYSLGALGFEALTGNPPYDGEDGFAIAYAHVFEPVPTLPENRRHWQPLIDRAMAKDPAERFQGTDEFLAALERLSALAEPVGTGKSRAAADAPTVPLPTLPKLFASAAAMASNLVSRKPSPGAEPEAASAVPLPRAASAAPPAAAAAVAAAPKPTLQAAVKPHPPAPAAPVPAAEAPTRVAPLPTAPGAPAGAAPAEPKAPPPAAQGNKPPAPTVAKAEPRAPLGATPALHEQVTPLSNRVPITETELPRLGPSAKASAPGGTASASALTRPANRPATGVGPEPKTEPKTPSPAARLREPPVPNPTAGQGWLSRHRSPAIALSAVAAVLILGTLLWSSRSERPDSGPVPTDRSAVTEAPPPQAESGPAIDDAGPEADASDPELAISEDAWLVPADPNLQSEAERAYYQVAVATTVIDPVANQLRLARADLAAQRLSQPPGRNAAERYALVLQLEPKNAEARTGLLETGRAYAKMAASALAEGQLDQWQEHSKRAIAVAGEFDTAGELSQNYQSALDQLLNTALAEGQKALARWDEASATRAFERMLALVPGHAEATALLKQARGIGKPGYVFSDQVGAGKGPELIVKRINGKRLGIGRTEVTVDQFRQFWAAAGATSQAERPSCRDRESGFRSSRSRSWQSPGFAQTGTHPVVCVSWLDAEAYAAWLSRASGQRYRLASAAEWTALASSAAAATDCRANIGDRRFDARYRDRSALNCDDGAGETASARRYAAVDGVFDLVGNVREWVADCAGNCRKHLAMGSSWASVQGDLGPGPREDFDRDTGFNTVGLRVVREID